MYSQSEPKVININQGLAKIHNHKSFKWSQNQTNKIQWIRMAINDYGGWYTDSWWLDDDDGDGFFGRMRSPILPNIYDCFYISHKTKDP